MITRICDSCKNIITGNEYIAVSIALYSIDDTKDTTAKEREEGDFCDNCIKEGKAIEILINKGNIRYD